MSESKKGIARTDLLFDFFFCENVRKLLTNNCGFAIIISLKDWQSRCDLPLE